MAEERRRRVEEEPGAWERVGEAEPRRPRVEEETSRELGRLAERIYRPELAERLRRSLAARMGAARRWAEYYRRMYEETGAEYYRRRAVEKAAEYERLRDAYLQLKAVGFDLYRLAVAEVYRAATLGRTVFTVPDALPEWARELYKSFLVHAAAKHHTLVGEKRTGWSGFVDCDGEGLDALRAARPSDRVAIYAYVTMEEEETYRDEYGRVKVTDTVTIRIGSARLGDIDPREVFARAYEAARKWAEAHGYRVADVCVVVRGEWA